MILRQYLLQTMKEAFVILKKLVFVILTGILIFLTGIAQARVSGMTVAVDGIACPFCAYGVEKRLKTVNGVGTVNVDMKTGIANLVAKPKVAIHYQKVPEAIKEAGFTAGVMTITVIGTVEREKNSSFLILFDGPSLLLEPANSEVAALLRDVSDRGATVVLHGVLEKKSANWVLQPETIELIP